MAIIDKFNTRADAVNSLVCVGLDPDYAKLPEHFQQNQYPQFTFNRWIIEQTHEFAAAYKPNIAFYEARGDAGIHELKLTVDYLQRNHPDIFLICDAKRGDNSVTNQGYVASIFDWYDFDAVTLHSFLGAEAMQPFLTRADKGCIVLCRTSNPGSGEFQNLDFGGKPFWQHVAIQVRDHWNKNDNCMLVMGATYPEEVKLVRELVGDMTLLVPGIGAQGGNLQQTVTFGVNSLNKGLIINSSRGIIFSEDPARAAQELRDAINEFR
ncbi:MAG: orotidine-5'-phosphate decarboxylase [Aggregatilineales bacterium]